MVRRIAVVLTVLVLAMSTASFSFAELIISPERTTVVSSLPEVVLYMDTDQNYKANIKNTEVFVNEEKTDVQEVKRFSKTDEGITYFILIDTSNSILENDFKTIKEGIKEFTSMLHAADKVILLPFEEFTDSEDVIYAPTDKKLAIVIDDLKRGDDYAQLYNVIYHTGEIATNEQMSEVPDRKVAMVFTDGADEGADGFAYEKDVVKKMTSAGIPLHAFVIGENVEAQDRLGEICRALNGSISIIDKNDPEAVFVEFKKIIDNTLMIKTCVRNPETIGVGFTVEVQVDDKPILVKEDILVTRAEETKGGVITAIKKLVMEYPWIVLIIVAVLIVLISLLVVRKKSKVIYEEGKVIYASKPQKKRTLEKTESIGAGKIESSPESQTIRLEPTSYENLTEEDVLVGISSIVGTRKNQQDSYEIYKASFENHVIAVVCDGMGGLAGGELASKTATEHILQQLKKAERNETLPSVMVQALKSANVLVKNLKSEEGLSLKAGTTAVAVVIKDGKLNWCSVGDSKIYLFKKGVFRCLTNEHNYKFLVEKKKNDSNFRYDPNARQDALVSYLGADELRYIDINHETVRLTNDDTVLLCSDGLYKSLNEEDIVEILADNTMSIEEIARKLTGKALRNAKGNQDNTTVVVLRYQAK